VLDTGEGGLCRQEEVKNRDEGERGGGSGSYLRGEPGGTGDNLGKGGKSRKNRPLLRNLKGGREEERACRFLGHGLEPGFRALEDCLFFDSEEKVM